ncbi:MAG TPA: recombinase family protein [Caulobacteraceae bacterium]
MSRLKRALVYTRDACRLQGAPASPDQLNACRAYAREQGMIVVGHYNDFGSGLVIRQGLQSLWADLRAGKADAVITRDAARLSRSAADLYELLEEAASLGVTVHTVKGEIGLECLDPKGGSR